jgi:hypothetical protein
LSAAEITSLGCPRLLATFYLHQWVQ